MKFGPYHFLTDIAKTERGRILLRKYLPSWEQLANVESTTIGSLLERTPVLLSRDGLLHLLEEMNAPIEIVLPETSERKSLDEVELELFHPGPSPLSGEAERIVLSIEEGSTPHAAVREACSLDGDWELAAEIDGKPAWEQAVPAAVPGSVHTALVRAGLMPDTTVGRNQELGRKASYQNWWYRRRFSCTSSAPTRLVFDGVANRCTVWLNGSLLGEHEGMFGGPEFDVSDRLQSENTLVVKLDAIPEEYTPVPEGAVKFNTPNNHSWRHTVVSNNVYGWHYSCMPSIGIWNDVRLERVPDVALFHPFIATIDHETGLMRLAVEFRTCKSTWGGTLSCHIQPQNFEGPGFVFQKAVAMKGDGKLLLEFVLPQAQLWWPNNLGPQNLYRLTLSLDLDGGLTGDVYSTTFGVRTVRMAPLAEGPEENTYNWRFIVNGKATFIRGTGWCTMDAMMDFSRGRYDRFLRLAHIQNCQMIRAWGAGMPEKNDFYELCDQYGIMVMQEWPTAWDSHLTQPYAMLEETVVSNTLRIRNHPSLILYCPGNESANPFGEAIDMMGRYATELDGTRAFHRGEPWGGSRHNYDSYWGRQSLDVHVNLEAKFFGEFGIACTPCAESVNRYLPEDEKNVWPARENGGFEYHTPIFGTAEDLSRLRQLTGYFTRPDCSFEQMTLASQFSQILGVRHTLERARIRYPYCGGALYYKLNDNFPAVSWATVDWYGAPKLAHYVIQKSYAPTACFLLPHTLNFSGTAHTLPVYLADDHYASGDAYRAHIVAYDGKLRQIAEQRIDYDGDLSVPDCVGQLHLSYESLVEPLTLCFVELEKNGKKIFDTFYFFNYEAKKGCLFDLPHSNLAWVADGQSVTITNTGALPCVGVMIEQPGHADTFTTMESFFWLEPGAQKTVRVSTTEGLKIHALNTEE